MPDAAITLTEDPQPLLEAAVATGDEILQSWSIDATHARPGAETSVGYDVTVSGQQQYLVASTVELTATQRDAAGAVRLEAEGAAVHVWRHPRDPLLPGLWDACHVDRIGARVSEALGGEVALTDLTLLVLRPLRRAVLRAHLTDHERTRTVFLKVLRPDRVDALLSRHAATALAPRASHLGDGIVLVEHADGIALTRILHRPPGGPDQPVPDPDTVDPAVLIAALDGISAAALDIKARPSPPDRLETFAPAAIRAGAPAERIDTVVARIAPILQADDAPLVPTHGDFHPANVFLDDSAAPQVAAMIDVDTLGPGRRSDDLACMIAHLLTLPGLDPDGYRAVQPFAERVRDEFARHVQPDLLAARTAAQLVSLLPGAPSQQVREHWLDSAEQEAARIGQPSAPDHRR